MRFLGLGLADGVTDAKSVWLFREHLTRASATDGPFAVLDAWLNSQGHLVMSGRIQGVSRSSGVPAQAF